jgi:hypothetical protein
MRLLRLAILLACSTAAPLRGQSPVQQATPTSVPVNTVMLFSSGVGYFEHAGTVRGDGSTELRFRTNQINDILKSLVVQDQSGGRVSTISYPSQNPLAKTLRSFQVDITANPSFADLLNQLRGAQVTIQFQAERLTGTILGVEQRTKSIGPSEAASVAVLNIISGATIRAIELQSITSLTLDDPVLQAELTRALAALTGARDQDKKPVTINFSGSGDRRVRFGYVVETPIWKTSYRLLMDDRGDKLQGWAIVENQTDSDWNGVSLSLVSGRPISFMMDLYQPLYATRPTVVPELYASLRPQVYDDGISGGRQREEMAALTGAASAPAATLMERSMARRLADSAQFGVNRLQSVVVTGTGAGEDMDMAASIQSLAEAGRMGALFQYVIGNVTLPRQTSAMLPIITDSIALERVSIYNAGVLAKYPLNGVRLRNVTGKHLLQGPVTVLDANRYAGDARIDDVPPGQERLISYGIDLDMQVDDTKNTRTSAIVTARIAKGALIVDRRHVSSHEYLADNKGTKDRMLVIEHPIEEGWKLVDTRKPIESTREVYRFQGNAPAGKVTTLTVKEEIVRAETIGILPADLGVLVTYSRTGEIPAAVRDALTRAIQLRRAIIDTERQLAERGQRIAEISAEQNRIRENMKTVAQNAQYYQRLLAKLNEQETALEKLQEERDGLGRKREAERRELEAYLAALTVG